MLKNKFKTLLVLTITFILLFCPFVMADDEDIDEMDNEYAEETDTISGESQNDSSKENDVYIFDNDVTLDYPVSGNVFIFANNVNIKSKIEGDLFVCAKNLTIENAYVYNNVFVAAENFKLNGVVFDLYSACSKVDIGEDGYVYRDIHSGSNEINILGKIGRNAYIDCNKISLASDGDNSESATIYGDLNYSSTSEANISEDLVGGKVNFTPMSVKSTNTWKDILISIVTSIIFVVLVYLAITWLAPNFKKKLDDTLTKNIGAVIGLGILALIVIPIIAFVLLITSVGATAALLLGTLYGVLLAISSTIFIIAISSIISNKVNVNNTFAKIGIVAGLTLIISLLKLVPYLSTIITIICVWLGTGIIVKQLLPSKNSEN